MSKQLIAVLLVLVLPAGGYMVWQKQQQAKRRAAMKAAAAAPAASSAGLFTGSAAAPASTTPGANAATTASTPLSASAAPAQMPNAAAAPMAAQASGSPTQDAPASAVPAAVPVEAPVSTGPAASLFSPKTTRDPMQSVSERQMLEMYKNRESLSRELAKRAKLDADRNNKKKRPAVESTMVLQGIMEIQGRLTALVNGEMVSKGQTIRGVKIVNISHTSVTFESKGKRFTKSVKDKVK